MSSSKIPKVKFHLFLPMDRPQMVKKTLGNYFVNNSEKPITIKRMSHRSEHHLKRLRHQWRESLSSILLKWNYQRKDATKRIL